MQTICNTCGVGIYKKQYDIKHYKNQYCSLGCMYNRKIKSHMEIPCKNCGKNVTKKKSEIKRVKNSFCSSSCSNSFHNKLNLRNYKDGSGSYRERAIREYGLTCSNTECEITLKGIIIPESMFDVDHVNGKIMGHELSNLQVLCVWCHTKKTRLDNKY